MKLSFLVAFLFFRPSFSTDLPVVNLDYSYDSRDSKEENFKNFMQDFGKSLGLSLTFKKADEMNLVDSLDDMKAPIRAKRIQMADSSIGKGGNNPSEGIPTIQQVKNTTLGEVNIQNNLIIPMGKLTPILNSELRTTVSQRFPPQDVTSTRNFNPPIEAFRSTNRVPIGEVTKEPRNVTRNETTTVVMSTKIPAVRSTTPPFNSSTNRLQIPPLVGNTTIGQTPRVENTTIRMNGTMSQSTRTAGFPIQIEVTRNSSIEYTPQTHSTREMTMGNTTIAISNSTQSGMPVIVPFVEQTTTRNTTTTGGTTPGVVSSTKTPSLIQTTVEVLESSDKTTQREEKTIMGRATNGTIQTERTTSNPGTSAEMTTIGDTSTSNETEEFVEEATVPLPQVLPEAGPTTEDAMRTTTEYSLINSSRTSTTTINPRQESEEFPWWILLIVMVVIILLIAGIAIICVICRKKKKKSKEKKKVKQNKTSQGAEEKKKKAVEEPKKKTKALENKMAKSSPRSSSIPIESPPPVAAVKPTVEDENNQKRTAEEPVSPKVRGEEVEEVRRPPSPPPKISKKLLPKRLQRRRLSTETTRTSSPSTSIGDTTRNKFTTTTTESEESRKKEPLVERNIRLVEYGGGWKEVRQVPSDFSFDVTSTEKEE